MELLDALTQRQEALRQSNSELPSDISDRKRAEAALHASEEWFRLRHRGLAGFVYDWADPQPGAVLWRPRHIL